MKKPALFPAILALLLCQQLSAQPIPVSGETAGARYVFTVYTPTSLSEATIWRSDSTLLTTHRLSTGSGGKQVQLQPARHTTLRTYVDLGAAAGAINVDEEPGGPVVKEVLCYQDHLSPEQRQLTESYLAIKHGLTLDQATPTHYLALDDSAQPFPVWTATAAPEFRHRITGLARDTASRLTVSRSSSVFAPDLLRLNWAEVPDGQAYFILADNDLPTARGVATGDGLQFLQRRWRVETTGSVPETTLQFAPSRFFARAVPGERLVLSLQSGASGVEAHSQLLEQTTKGCFTLPATATDTSFFLQLALACDACQSPEQLDTEDDFFRSVRLSPNPVKSGLSAQVRVALERKSALILTAFDDLGRQVSTQSLPPSTHHLTELTFPRPGTYTLHLRPRLRSRRAPSTSLLLLVH